MQNNMMSQMPMVGAQSQATEMAPPPMEGLPQPDIHAPAPQQEENVSARLTRLLQTKNIAETLDDDMLVKIGAECKAGFESDLLSREQWEKDLETWTKLAMQVKEEKTYPWVNASNVQYPILATASMQFAARAYPSLVPSDGKIVKSVVIGKDADGSKAELATRVSTYMSWQILRDMDNWEEDMDKLLIMLPIAGTVFKKTYWDTQSEKVKSCLVLPKFLVVDNWTTSLESAERISEVIPMTKRMYQERINKKTFKNVDLGQPVSPQIVAGDSNKNNTGKLDVTVPYTFIEQHTFLDLDEDGYTEPYIVTFHRESGKVVKIVPRFSVDDVETDGSGIVIIKPTQYYTKFSFVPNPDGSFYSIGFGRLLGPLNLAVNTLINQLIDAGTLSNLQGGFIGKGLRIKAGAQAFAPGEWKPVNATGDDLRKQIVQLPAKEPSKVLFELMNALVSSTKELASVAEIFVGKMPGQNTPATTTMATIEQGMKVFTAVYKRIFRSLQEEFYKIFELNEIYMDPNTYVNVLDLEIGPDDFNDDNYDICPGADPNAMSQTEKLQKAQGLLELLPLGALDPVAVVRRMLQAQEQPNWEQLLSQAVQQTGALPEAPPDPKLQEMEMKGQLEQQKVALKGQEQQHKMELEGRSAEQKMQMQAAEHAQNMANKEQEAKLDAAVAVHKQRIFSATEQAKVNQGLMHNQDTHKQDLQNSKELSSAKVAATRAQAAARPKKNSTSGKPKK
jgi:chaperonin GroES